jgi:aminoglycoside phosphotransferase (APT) family kinase protein
MKQLSYKLAPMSRQERDQLELRAKLSGYPLDVRQAMDGSTSQMLVGWHADVLESQLNLSDIEPLQLDERTQIYLARMSDGQQVIAKRHDEWASYFRELRAFELIGSRAPLPRLLATSDSSQFIIMEYLPEPFVANTQAKLYEVARTLGRLHTCGVNNASLFKYFSQDATLGYLIRRTDSYSWLADEDALREALSLAALRLGEDYVPIQLGDIKNSHLRARDGCCTFIDLETLTFGGFEFFDLLSLIIIARDNDLEEYEWVGLTEAYLAGRGGDESSNLSLAEMLWALQLSSIALGLPQDLTERIPSLS